jgi:hypothetical protein
VASPLQLNSGTLVDGTGNTATLTFTPPTTTGVLVDTTAPTITGIALDNPNSCGGDGLCVTGDTLRYIVTFSEPVTLTGAGTLTVPLTFGSGAASAVYTNSAPTTTSTVTVSRTILAGDTHLTGNIALATPLTLSTLTIADAAGNAASLTHSSSSLGGILITQIPVNTLAPTVSGVGYNDQTMTCNPGTWANSPPTSYAYKWYSTGAEIVGQTASTYTVTSTTEGTPLTCAAAGTNAAGTSAYTMASNIIDNFVPGDLGASTIDLWLDASDSSTITQTGGLVSQWNDKSGNGRNVSQGTSGNRPTYSSSDVSLGNKPVITFNGSNQSFNTRSIPTLSATNVTWVEKKDGNGGSGYGNLFDLSHPSSGFGNQGLRGPEECNMVYNNSSPQVLGIDTSCGTSSQRIVSVNLSTLGGTSWKNGDTNWSNSNSWTGATGNFALGRGFDAGRYYQGRLQEFIVHSRILTTTERQKLEGYLAHKWGLTANLPAGHPYKTMAPLP